MTSPRQTVSSAARDSREGIFWSHPSAVYGGKNNPPAWEIRMELSGGTAEDKKDGEYSGENVRIDSCTPKSATFDVVDTVIGQKDAFVG